MSYVSDFINIYPSPFDRNFQRDISSIYEFSQFKATATEELVAGGYFKHQKLTHQLLQVVDNLLVMSATGTGKSKEVLGFIDLALREYDNEKLGRPFNDRISRFSKTIIMVPGDAQKNEIMKQLVCDINQSYLTPEVVNADTEKKRNSALKRVLVRAGVEIVNYRKLANYIRRTYPDTNEGNYRLSKDYSDVIFWGDEIHTITGPDREDEASTYEPLWRLFQYSTRSIKIISSATPMINSEEELRLVLNLILPYLMPEDINWETLTDSERLCWFQGKYPKSKEQAMSMFNGQIDPYFRFRTASPEIIEVYLRGKVVYVRALDNGIDVKYVGSEIGTPQYDNETGNTFIATTITENTLMSDHQSNAYFRLKGLGGVYKNETQASLFVFPDGEITTNDPNRGFSRYIAKLNNRYIAKPDLKKYINTLDGIYFLSAKMGKAVELTTTLPGKDFMFCEYVTLGTIPLSLCLEAQGFMRFSERYSVFEGDEEEVQSYCSNVSKKNKRIRKDFPKANRYAIFDGETERDQVGPMFEIFNSYENRFGEYVKCIVVSRVGRDGINLADIYRVHLLTPGWNDSVNYQAESRGIRATSHVYTLQEVKKDFIERGEDPLLARFTVEIYNHCAVAQRGSEMESIDMQIYITAEAKSRQNHVIIRYLKQAAIGCRINYDRNVRSTDKDYSKACDYRECNYPCFSEEPNTEVDYDSYNSDYAKVLIPEIQTEIRKLFLDYDELAEEDIILKLVKYRKLQIVDALKDLVINRIGILDKYGLINFLNKEGDFYIMSKNDNYRSLPSPFVLLQEQEFEDVEGTVDPAYVERQYTQGNPIDDLISKLDPSNRSIVLEDAIIKYYMGKGNKEYVSYILNKFKRFYFIVNEPVTAITELTSTKGLGKKKRGKKAKNPEAIKIKNYKEKELDAFIEKGYKDPNGRPLILHIVYSQTVDRAKYAAVARFNKAEGKIRMLDPRILEWEDVPQFEVPEYNKLIQIENRIRTRELEKFGIYGILEIDGTFRIRNRLDEQEGSDNNGRKIMRGKVCETYNRKKLIDIMWYIGVTLENMKLGVALNEEERQKIINFLLNHDVNHERDELVTWESSKLLYYSWWYYNWFEEQDKTKKKTTENICNYINRTMVSKNLMY